MKNFLFIFIALLGFSLLHADTTKKTIFTKNLLKAIHETDINKLDEILTPENVRSISPDTADVLMRISHRHLADLQNSAKGYHDQIKISVGSIILGLAIIMVLQQNPSLNINAQNGTIGISQRTGYAAEDHSKAVFANNIMLAATLNIIFNAIFDVSCQWSISKAEKIVKKLEYLCVQAKQEKES